MSDRKKINFLFHPCNPTTHEIIKSGGENSRDDGKNRYLCGITSGMAVDYHGDRMAKECVDDMNRQAKEKDITLYANHNKDFNRAIGILEKAEITSTGDLYCEYRLWNEDDGMPQLEFEDSQNIWKMINGIRPYTKKRQFGFSIEGFVDNKDIEKSASGRIIKKIDLDPGVSLVTKPAYGYSVASAVMKSLDSAEIKKDILDVAIDNKNKQSDIYTDKWEIEDAMRMSVDAVLEAERTPQEKAALLEEIYDSYKTKMISLYSRVDYKVPGADSTALIVNSPGLAKALRKTIGVLKAIQTKI